MRVGTPISILVRALNSSLGRYKPCITNSKVCSRMIPIILINYGFLIRILIAKLIDASRLPNSLQCKEMHAFLLIFIPVRVNGHTFYEMSKRPELSHPLPSSHKHLIYNDSLNV